MQAKSATMAVSTPATATTSSPPGVVRAGRGNYYFEFGTDVLTPAGMEKLLSLTRVRPAPDPKLYIQTARDLPANLDPLYAANEGKEQDGNPEAIDVR